MRIRPPVMTPYQIAGPEQSRQPAASFRGDVLRKWRRAVPRIERIYGK
jgi:hypothetical protein